MISLPPIYSEVYHLTREILLHSKGFPKHYRPTLGRMMEEAAVDLTISLRTELLKKGRRIYEPMSGRVDQLKVLVQLCHDIEVMDHHHFNTMVKSLEKIGKMLGGLEKAQKGLGG